MDEIVEALSSLQTIIAAGAGLLAGAVGSLVAPWVHWAIEARRERLASRRRLIAELRATINHHMAEDDDFGFLRDTAYSRLRPYMDPKVVESLERPSTFHVRKDIPGAPPATLSSLAREVSRIERDWKLI